MLTVPDSSVLIPYLMQRAYMARIDRLIHTGRLVLCSVVAEEIMAGARDQDERRRYDRFFAPFVNRSRSQSSQTFRAPTTFR